MRTIARILILSLAAAAFIGLAGLWADSIHPDSQREREWTVRRKLEPQLHRVPSFMGDIVIIGLIAFGGRAILRIRLTSRSPRSFLS